MGVTEITFEVQVLELSLELLGSFASHFTPIEFTLKSLCDSSLAQDRKKNEQKTIYGLELGLLYIIFLFSPPFVCVIISSDNW